MKTEKEIQKEIKKEIDAVFDCMTNKTEFDMNINESKIDVLFWVLGREK